MFTDNAGAHYKYISPTGGLFWIFLSFSVFYSVSAPFKILGNFFKSVTWLWTNVQILVELEWTI